MRDAHTDDWSVVVRRFWLTLYEEELKGIEKRVQNLWKIANESHGPEAQGRYIDYQTASSLADAAKFLCEDDMHGDENALACIDWLLMLMEQDKLGELIVATT